MRVSIVVTTYNRPDALLKVLQGLAHQTVAPDEVIVADDGSDPATATALAENKKNWPYPLLHVWHADRGFRAAKIRNDAIRQSSGAYVVLLDGDCIPNRHFVDDHIRLAKSGCFFQGKRVLVRKKSAAAFDWRDTGSFMSLMRLMLSGSLGNAHHLVRLAWFPAVGSSGLSGTRSCNLGIFRSDLFAVNGFNESFVGWGREDSELVVRLFAYGLKRRIHPFRAICFHLWHADNSRERLDHNDAILKKAVASNDYYIRRGLVKKS